MIRRILSTPPGRGSASRAACASVWKRIVFAGMVPFGFCSPAGQATAVESAAARTVAVAGAPAHPARPQPDAAAVNLIRNGGFSEQPNPLGFWTNAPGAFVTWGSSGAEASVGSAEVRFFPPASSGVSLRGAVFHTGLTQCVPVPGPGRYLLSGYSRVPETASASSIAGLGWRLRFDSPGCNGASDGEGRVGFQRSVDWVASSIESIDVDAGQWTSGTTLEITVEVGDSSTISVEAVEAFVDEIVLIEGPLFRDGFED